eukprot:9006052-Heterocapsa_arctica.AAC.1
MIPCGVALASRWPMETWRAGLLAPTAAVAVSALLLAAIPAAEGVHVSRGSNQGDASLGEKGNLNNNIVQNRIA